jgi:hypothetical protein
VLSYLNVPLARAPRQETGEPDAVSDGIDYAKFFSRPHDALIRVYDDAGNVIETQEHAGDFKEW